MRSSHQTHTAIDMAEGELTYLSIAQLRLPISYLYILTVLEVKWYVTLIYHFF